MKNSKVSLNFSGQIRHITFFNPVNNYTVARLKTNTPKNKLVTLVGTLPKLSAGQLVNVWGKLKTHPKYGKYLAVEGLENKQPTNLGGIQAYLASDLIKGVGSVLAKRIVKKFGQKTLQVLEKQPQKLAQIKGITKTKAQKIGADWAEKQKLQQTMIGLQGLGISLNLSQRIINHYQGTALSVIKHNPYQLTYDLFGVGFLTADKIAGQAGISKNDPRRIKAATIYVLRQAQAKGHVFLPRSLLQKKVLSLIKAEENPQETLDNAFNSLVKEKRIVIEKGSQIFLKNLYQAEKESAALLKRLLNAKTSSKLTRLHTLPFEKIFEKFAKNHHFKPALQQKKAVISAVLHPVSIVSGGPGTGKSTTVRMLINALGASNIKTTLCAPTGRAAKRLSELTLQEAFTIHRLLKIRPGKAPDYNETNPLSTDFIVVDETSMLDLPLFHSLLKAIKPGTHLLLVGDADQLPSVGPGNVLKDLIQSKHIPTTFLEVIFRQKRKSQIIQNAHRIKEGRFPLFLKHPTDFYLFVENQPEEAVQAAQTIVELLSRKIPQNFGVATEKIQVLTPIYKGAAGVLALNEKLQNKLNPAASYKPEITSGQKIWRVGDKVLQLSNNYEKEVFNGDLGVIQTIQLDSSPTTVNVNFNGQIVNYKPSELDQLTHAFAITIHKSQGSEFDAVVMPILTSHYIMLERNLLYTGVSRAKKLLVLVGNKKALSIAIRNNNPHKRYTGLLQKIVENTKKGADKCH